ASPTLHSCPTRRSSDLAFPARVGTQRSKGRPGPSSLEEGTPRPWSIVARRRAPSDVIVRRLFRDDDIVNMALAEPLPCHPDELRSEEHTSELQSRENLV